MSMIFDFQGVILVGLLFICTCSYLRPRFGAFVHPKSPGMAGVLGRAAVIGDRLSPWVCASCVIMAGMTLFVR
eukprot:NODE_31853_length_388_cov_2.337165.p3 GENE.NODE_31853_length_388_cov_2.337165~~NODE_31853_length_388_cov_2.337165.p3  ORF type:complete len:73 (-),score=20.36 NODE_31853_length_388_cov_2.337165:57-275(-)